MTKHRKFTMKWYEICLVLVGLLQPRVHGLTLNASQAVLGEQTCSAKLDHILESLESLKNIVSETNQGTHYSDTLNVQANDVYERCINNFKKPDDASRAFCLEMKLLSLKELDQTTRDRRDASTANEGERKKRQTQWTIHDFRNPDDITLTRDGRVRIRKEIHTLTSLEMNLVREGFRRAYEEGITQVFAEAHEDNGGAIHRGQAFLPWHRCFIFYFEEAVRSLPGLQDFALPYFDNTLEATFVFDTDMPVFFSSAFSNDRIGTGLGLVDYPGLGSRTMVHRDNRPVLRDIGGDGNLMDARTVENFINSRCGFMNYFSELERMHDGVHVYCGRTMNSYLAPYDPIFFLHHCYIDYVWEKTREKQRDCNPPIDPNTDYISGDARVEDTHLANYTMPFMEPLKNMDGVRGWWTGENKFIRYQDTPACINRCHTDHGGILEDACDFEGLNACVPYIDWNWIYLHTAQTLDVATESDNEAISNNNAIAERDALALIGISDSSKRRKRGARRGRRGRGFGINRQPPGLDRRPTGQGFVPPGLIRQPGQTQPGRGNSGFNIFPKSIRPFNELNVPRGLSATNKFLDRIGLSRKISQIPGICEKVIYFDTCERHKPPPRQRTVEEVAKDVAIGFYKKPKEAEAVQKMLDKRKQYQQKYPPRSTDFVFSADPVAENSPVAVASAVYNYIMLEERDRKRGRKRKILTKPPK